LPPIEVLRFVRDYMEKLERELIALSRKAPTLSLRVAVLALASTKIISLEILRAVMRALDRLDAFKSFEQQVKRTAIQTEARKQDLERVLTKLVEIEAYQRDLLKALKMTSESVEREELVKVLKLVESVESKFEDDLRELIEGIRREISTL